MRQWNNTCYELVDLCCVYTLVISQQNTTREGSFFPQFSYVLVPVHQSN